MTVNLAESVVDELRAPCRIVGVLDDGVASLSQHALAAIQGADVVIGAERTLDLFKDVFAKKAERRDLGGQLSKVPDWITESMAKGKAVVVLATGDPLCHGIGAFLQSRLCVDACEIIPNVSTLQLACARLGLSWNDLHIASIHTRDASEWHEGAGPEHGMYALLESIVRRDRLAVFTSLENSPDRIARMLLLEGLGETYRMGVAERLLQKDERVYANLSVADAAQLHFSDPNIALLWRVQPKKEVVLFGQGDEQFKQRYPDKGLITKREVRAVSLARMQLRANSIVWDIGAGSGSVGLEAARLCSHGYVYAVEKNADDYAIAKENCKNMDIHNYAVFHAKAPQGMEMWPDPDAVFIGGSGGELKELIELSLARIKSDGWLVMNFVTFENVGTAIAVLKHLDAEWDLTQLQASRSKPILEMHRLSAENPVWIVCARKLKEKN